MLAGDFFNSLAKMAGIDEKDENLVKLLAIKEVATAEVADDLANKITGSLMTKDGALNNKEIVDEIWAKAMNPVDDKLNALAKDVFNMDDTFIDTMKNTKGTYSRMDLFAKQISEVQKAAIKVLEEAKDGTGDPKAKTELQAKIDTLNGELVTLKESTVSATEHQETIDGYEGIILDQHVKNMFSNYDYAMDVSKDVNIGVASSIFQNELTKLGVELVNDSGNLALKTKLESGEYAEYYNKEHKKVTPKDLADGLLAEHKLLKVTNGTPPTPVGTPLATPIPGTPPANGADPSAVAIATQHVESLKTLGEATPA